MIKLINRNLAEIILPLTVDIDELPFEVEIPLEEVGQGAVVVGKERYLHREFHITGVLAFGSKQENQQAYDSLMRLLKSPPVGVSYDGQREIYGYMRRGRLERTHHGDEYYIDIDMLAPDPFFYGETLRDEHLGITGEDTWEIESDGVMPSFPVISIFVVSGEPENITLHIGNYSFGMGGSFESEDVIVADCRHMQVTVNGDSAIGSASDDFLIHGAKVLPDINSVLFEADGTYEVNVVIEWRPRYL